MPRARCRPQTGAARLRQSLTTSCLSDQDQLTCSDADQQKRCGEHFVAHDGVLRFAMLLHDMQPGHDVNDVKEMSGLCSLIYTAHSAPRRSFVMSVPTCIRKLQACNMSGKYAGEKVGEKPHKSRPAYLVYVCTGQNAACEGFSVSAARCLRRRQFDCLAYECEGRVYMDLGMTAALARAKAGSDSAAPKRALPLRYLEAV